MNDHHMEGAEPGAAELEAMKERLYAFCFPNVPHTADEQAAFEQAARLQYAHEETARAALEGMPESVTEFRIGDFQMHFGDSEGGGLTARTVCPAAYGLLLRHGLLYRGAEGRRGHAD